MASTREQLIGRPLVPYFDQDENINASLSYSDAQYEDLEVDARVWNKELGYFEYPSDQPPPAKQTTNAKPSEQQTKNNRSNSSKRNARKTQPMAIANGTLKRTNSFTTTSSEYTGEAIAPPPHSTGGIAGKLLLTPAMLSSSCPDTSASSMMRQLGNTDPTVPADASRSSSAKRSSSKQRSRPNTPVRTRNNKQQTQQPPQAAPSTNSDPAAPKETKSSKKKSKSKQELSAAVGKFAWSAFQSSPDPKQLPLPPFLSNGSSPALTAAPSPPMPLAATTTTLAATAEPSVERSPPTMVPPLAEKHPPLPDSVEASMTADLRRMLNIGGG